MQQLTGQAVQPALTGPCTTYEKRCPEETVLYRLVPKRAEIVPRGPINDSETADELDNAPQHASSARVSWAQLLQRVFDIDIERCPHCGGTMKIIAAILEPTVITKILAHLGLPTRAPPRAPAQSLNLFEMA